MASPLLILASCVGMAAAYPMLYNERIGVCEIPTMTFGPHKDAGDVTPMNTITFTTQDAQGGMVPTWMPGETYTLMITAYSDAPVYLWVHASEGEFMNAASVCSNAAFFGMPGGEPPKTLHSFEWTAPSEVTTECVKLSTAQATGPGDFYRTAAAEFCPDSGDAAGPAAAAGPLMAADPAADTTMPAPGAGTGAGTGTPGGPSPALSPTDGAVATSGAALAGAAMLMAVLAV